MANRDPARSQPLGAFGSWCPDTGGILVLQPNFFSTALDFVAVVGFSAAGAFAGATEGLAA